MQRLAVYCGSSTGKDPVYADAARALGSAMVARNIDLVYGGGRLGLMGIIAYGVSQFLNVYIFSRLTQMSGAQMSGKLLAVRAAIASALSQVVDTIIFITIAFYGERPIADLLLGQGSAKVVLSFVLVPFLIIFFVKLGKRLDRDMVATAV